MEPAAVAAAVAQQSTVAASVMQPAEKVYGVLVLHVLTTVGLLLLSRYEKRLSSARYAWTCRALTLLCLLCVVCSGSMLPHDLSALAREFYAAPRPLCLADWDFTLRLLHALWSAALALCFFTRRARTRKLTLSASCRYVAFKYAYSYEKLMTTCRAHSYAFFPIAELEQYARNIEQGDGGENEPRAFTAGDIDHYLVQMDAQEQALLHNDATYEAQVKQARDAYERNRDPLVLARRRNATMSYEQYLAMKQQLQCIGE